MKINPIAPLMGAALAIALSGCQPTTATSGSVTSQGSIFVNGVEYDTSTATITINGEVATEADLLVGMNVDLIGTSDGTTGVATVVSYESALTGSVTGSYDPVTRTLEIMGHTVTLTPETAIEGVATADLIGVGAVCEVSGYAMGDGSIVATRIDVGYESSFSFFTDLLAAFNEGTLDSFASMIEVEGVVSNLDAVAETFNIGPMPVDYAGATLNLGGETLADGLVVDVNYSISINLVEFSFDMNVSEISLGDGDGHYGFDLVGTYSDFSLDGVVTVDADGTGLTVEINGQTIILNGETTYHNIDLASLTTGTDINCEGYVNDAGEFVATSISFDFHADSESTGSIEALVVDGTNAGSVTIGGVTYSITTQTVMDDDSIAALEHFNITFLATTDSVTLSYYTDAVTGELICTKLQRN